MTKDCQPSPSMCRRYAAHHLHRANECVNWPESVRNICQLFVRETSPLLFQRQCRNTSALQADGRQNGRSLRHSTECFRRAKIISGTSKSLELNLACRKINTSVHHLTEFFVQRRPVRPFIPGPVRTGALVRTIWQP